MQLKHVLFAAAATTLFAVSAARAVPSDKSVRSSGGDRAIAATGTLALHAELALQSTIGTCPAGTPDGISCWLTTGTGVVRGLGKVSEAYIRRVQQDPPDCGPDTFRLLSQTVALTVGGKGEIDIANPPSAQCLTRSSLDVPIFPPFTVTGGSGDYAGASGAGTLTQVSRITGPDRVGTDTWSGTLTVPGLDFDVTPPLLQGALDRLVRAPKGAKQLRVTYKVTAADAGPDPLPVTCQPRSGSRFRIGRTTVRCSATDTSGNTATARFTITVKAR